MTPLDKALEALLYASKDPEVTDKEFIRLAREAESAGATVWELLGIHALREGTLGRTISAEEVERVIGERRGQAN